jgi:hypothetical protein
MKRRWRLLTVLGVLVLAAACLLHPAVRWRLIGWARGEAFYDGRPTSCWKQEIETAYVEADLADGRPSMSIWLETPTLLEKWLAYWRGYDPVLKMFSAMPINDPTGLPVLIALLDDESVQVRRFAAHALRRLGPQATPAAAALVRATQDEDATVRRDAQAALELLMPVAP